ncbi:MAG: MFS transporter [Planctomycetia bacterium]|nr:MFS transporter [Planctomycetia bacterium]
MLWLVCFFNYADRQAIYAVFPLLGREFDFDKVELGLIGSAFMWVYAGGAPFAGLLADRLPRVHLILGGCIFWSFVTVATAWCSKLWHFVAVRAAEGLGETFYFPASMSLTADYHGPRTRSRAFAFHQSSVYIGTILGSWLGAMLAEWYGWRVGFFLFGIAGLVVAAVLYLFLREPERGAAECESPSLQSHMHVAHAVTSDVAHQPLGFRETLRLILGRPVTLLLMIAFLGANFVATIFLTWTPTFLVEKFGYSLGAAGLNGALFIHLASAVSAPLAGIAADRLAQWFAGGRIVVQAAGLVIGSVFVATVGLCTTTPVLVVAMTAFGLCKGCYDAGIFASLYDEIEPRARASAAGVMNTVGWGGGALGPLFVGLATKYGGGGNDVENMSRAIACGGVVYLVCGLLLGVAILCSRKLPLA